MNKHHDSANGDLMLEDVAPGRRDRRAGPQDRTLRDGPFAEAKELVVAYWPAGRAPASPGRYAPVNGLRMYYEIHGRGRPLVLLHGAFNTIETSFGALLPSLACDRQVIAIEQQAHGRTADIDRPLSPEQMADDTARLLRQLGVRQADVFGYSMGGTVALQLAVRYPALVRKLAVVAAASNTDAYDGELMRMVFDVDPMSDDAWTKDCRLAFQRVAPRPEQWPAAVARIKQSFVFGALRNAQLRAIRAPTLLVSGDVDPMVTGEHIAEMSRLVPDARLEMCPGADHVSVLQRAAPLIPGFLDAPLSKSG